VLIAKQQKGHRPQKSRAEGTMFTTLQGTRRHWFEPGLILKSGTITGV
jgi:hypothetical protein